MYSAGIDQLGGEMTDAGMNALVFRASQWRDLARVIEERWNTDTTKKPLVLVGFSYGADDVLRVAQQLKLRGILVALIITIDPATPPAVPGNVRQCINYFEPNGVWDIFPWLRGIPLHAESDSTTLLNQDLRKDRRDLLEPNTSHANIAANPKLHREIIAQLRTILKIDDALHDPSAAR